MLDTVITLSDDPREALKEIAEKLNAITPERRNGIEDGRFVNFQQLYLLQNLAYEAERVAEK